MFWLLSCYLELANQLSVSQFLDCNNSCFSQFQMTVWHRQRSAVQCWVYSWCWSKAEVLELDLDPAPATSILLLLSPYVIHFCYQTFNFTLVFSFLVLCSCACSSSRKRCCIGLLIAFKLGFIYLSHHPTSPLKSSVILKLTGRFN